MMLRKMSSFFWTRQCYSYYPSFKAVLVLDQNNHTIYCACSRLLHFRACRRSLLKSNYLIGSKHFNGFNLQRFAIYHVLILLRTWYNAIVRSRFESSRKGALFRKRSGVLCRICRKKRRFYCVLPK